MKNLIHPADLASLRARLARLTSESQRQWGTLTVEEMLCHLSDAFRGVLGARAPNRSRPPSAKAILLKIVALYLPIPWPKGVPTREQVDPRRGGTRPTAFAADHAELLRLLDEFTTRAGGADTPHHFLFGRLSRKEWLRWGYLHVDHHLRQFGV